MPAKQCSAVTYFSVRWTPSGSQCDTDEEFVKKYQPLFETAMREKFERWVFQCERGERLGHLHLQGYACLKEKERPVPVGKWLGSNGLPGVVVQPGSVNGKQALKKYCMKKDTRVAGPWADKAIYLGQDLITTLYPWQEAVHQLVLSKPHPRKIYWFYDAIGGAGKSAFAKWLMFHHEVPCLTFGDAKDLLYVVQNFANRPAYLFDLSRTKGGKCSMSEIYQALESVKNGYFTSTKYESQMCLMQTPHVVVFSNHLPDMGCLSQDRWSIIDMNLIGLVKKPGSSKRSRKTNTSGTGDEGNLITSGAPEEPSLLVDSYVKKTSKKRKAKISADKDTEKLKRKVSKIPLEQHTPPEIWNNAQAIPPPTHPQEALQETTIQSQEA